MTESAALGPLDVKRVMAALPHRYPMLLVDRVESIEPDHKIVAVKAVTINEGFFQGHFPGRPIMARSAETEPASARHSAVAAWCVRSRSCSVETLPLA